MTGEHHLDSWLSVNHVTNLSITGELNTIIWCHNAYIFIANSASVEIKNITFINCGSVTRRASLIVHNVISFRIINIVFQNCFGYTIIGTNIQGNSNFENIEILQGTTTSSRYKHGILQLLFKETTNQCFQEANILISRCRFYNITLQEVNMDDFNTAAIKLAFCQRNYPAKVQIEDTTIENVKSNSGPLVDVSYSNVNRNDSQVILLNSNFNNNNNKNHSTIEINILIDKPSSSIKDLSLLKSTEKPPQWSFFLLNCKLRNNTSELKSILKSFTVQWLSII